MEQEHAVVHGCVRVLNWWQRVLPDIQRWVMAVLVKNDSSSEMRNLTLSLVPLEQTVSSCSRQLLDTTSHSKIVWIGKSPGTAVSKPPPLKRSRRTTAHSLSTKDDSLVSAGGATCVALSMNVPTFTSNSLVEFAVVAAWEWKEVDGLKTTEIFRFTLDVKDLFSEQFQCSYDCLGMWKGRFLILLSDCVHEFVHALLMQERGG